jgi:hypothetical protein
LLFAFFLRNKINPYSQWNAVRAAPATLIDVPAVLAAASDCMSNYDSFYGNGNGNGNGNGRGGGVGGAWHAAIAGGEVNDYIGGDETDCIAAAVDEKGFFPVFGCKSRSFIRIACILLFVFACSHAHFDHA